MQNQNKCLRMKIIFLHMRQWFALISLVAFLMFVKNYHNLKDLKLPYKLQKRTYTSIPTMKTDFANHINNKKSVIVEKVEISKISTSSYSSESISNLNESTIYNNKTFFSASVFTFSPFVNTFHYNSKFNSTTESIVVATKDYVTETVVNSNTELKTKAKQSITDTSLHTSSNEICSNFTRFCNASLAKSHNKPIHVKLPQNFLEVSLLKTVFRFSSFIFI